MDGWKDTRLQVWVAHKSRIGGIQEHIRIQRKSRWIVPSQPASRNFPSLSRPGSSKRTNWFTKALSQSSQDICPYKSGSGKQGAGDGFVNNIASNKQEGDCCLSCILMQERLSFHLYCWNLESEQNSIKDAPGFTLAFKMQSGHTCCWDHHRKSPMASSEVSSAFPYCNVCRKHISFFGLKSTYG